MKLIVYLSIILSSQEAAPTDVCASRAPSLSISQRQYDVMAHVDGAMWDHLKGKDVEVRALPPYLCLLSEES